MNNQTHQHIVIMAGGTGGHVFPGIAVADLLRTKGYEVSWLGAHGLETKLVPDAGITLKSLSIKGLRGKGLRGWLRVPYNLMCSILEARRYLKEVKPACVIGFGGFASVPGGIAAVLMRIPLIIHEQNAVAGLSNRLLSRMSKKTLTGFPCQLKNEQVVGNPVRTAMLTARSPKERFKLRNGMPLHILVLGGSQGAQKINSLIPDVAQSLVDKAIFWHQTGAQHFEAVQELWGQSNITPYRIEPFINDMLAAYEWADLVVCRSGALTIAELTAVGVGSILIPFPYAVDDHQTKNAQYLSCHQAAFLLQEKDISPRIVTKLVNSISHGQCLEMAENAWSRAQPQATEKIVEAVFTIIERRNQF